MVSGGTGGNPYYDNQLVNYGHLMYSLNFHQAKQGPPHQQTLSDQFTTPCHMQAKPDVSGVSGVSGEKQEGIGGQITCINFVAPKFLSMLKFLTAGS